MPAPRDDKARSLPNFFEPNTRRKRAPPGHADERHGSRQRTASPSPPTSSLTPLPSQEDPGVSLGEIEQLQAKHASNGAGKSGSNGAAQQTSSFVKDSDDDDSQQVLDDLGHSAMPMEEDSDAESLEDLEDLLGKFRKPVHNHTQKDGSSSRRFKTKFSLETLAKQQREYNASKAALEGVRSLVEADKRDDKKMLAPDGGDIIAKIVQGNEELDDVDRVRGAIQRTEALQFDFRWSFFEKKDIVKTGGLASLEDEEMDKVLADPVLLRQALSMGLVQKYASIRGLKKEFISSVVDMAISEQSPLIRKDYLKLLDTCDAPLRDMFTIDRIDDLFRGTGASEVAVDVAQPVSLKPVPRQTDSTPTTTHYLPFVKTVSIVSRSLTPTCKKHCIFLFCRMLFDQTLTEDSRILHLLEDSIDALTYDLLQTASLNAQIQLLSHIVTTLYSWTDDPSLQIQLLRHLPPMSATWHFLRRQLALACFYRDRAYLDISPLAHSTRSSPPSFSLERISTHLRTSPSFSLNRQSDYRALSASISILDIALSDCSPNTLPLPISPSPQPQSSTFNTSIDALAGQIKSLFLRIIDTGTSTAASHTSSTGGPSNMARSECKELLEQLQSRLLYSARTQPPALKKMLFSSHTLPDGKIGGTGKEGTWRAIAAEESQNHLQAERHGMQEFLKRGSAKS